MAKTLKRKKRVLKKIYKTRKFKNKPIKKRSKKKTKRSKKKIKGGAQRFGVMPALVNTHVEKKMDKDGNLVQIKNVSDQSPLQRSSSFSSQHSTTRDFNTGVRNVNSQMSSNLRKNIAGEPKLMSLDEVQKEANIRRQIQELKLHSNPLKKLQGHMWGLMPRTQTDNRILQTANQSLAAASDADPSFDRSYSHSSSSPSFNDWEYNYDEGESKSQSESKTPFKTTEV
jgi:hypothetical protein